MFTMTIHEYYYNDDNRVLYVEFSTKEDGDSFYRVLELNYEDIVYYSPQIIEEGDLDEIDVDFIIELINGYSDENGLPEELTL
jgi:hypothetical protein